MSGDWFKFYEDAVHDPKLLKLSDGLYRAWTILLCFASKNGGILPPADDIAAALREKPAKIAEWISKLKFAGLFDVVEGRFLPHNWEGRQYKVTDPTAATRMQRYRKRKTKDNPVTADVTTVTDRNALRLEEEVETEAEKNNSEANASGAEAPIDFRKRLFNEGLKKLAELTGKGPDACRSFVGKCLQAAGDDAVTVLGLIEEAARNRVVDPSAWIKARLPTTGPPGKPLTEHQTRRRQTESILHDLESFATGGRDGGQENPRLLPGNSSERSTAVRSGPLGELVVVSSSGGRESG